MKNPTPSVFVVVPTYWGPATGAIYDHPTPFDGESTLPRLLESLAVQQNAPPFRLVVLVSAVSLEYETLAANRVASLLAPYRRCLDLILTDGQTRAGLRYLLYAQGLALYLAPVRGYASVRNLQLLIPAILGAEVIVALDDDEVVAPDYLRRATEWIGRPRDGRPIVGLAGIAAQNVRLRQAWQAEMDGWYRRLNLAWAARQRKAASTPLKVRDLPTTSRALPKAPEALGELWDQLRSHLKALPKTASFRRVEVQRWLGLKPSRAGDVLRHGTAVGQLVALPRHRYRLLRYRM